MSAITLLDVAQTNANIFIAASDAWDRVAAGLDAGLDRFIAASQYLPAAWPTGEDAQERNLALRAELGDAHDPCQKIGRALRTHADTVLSMQSMLADIQTECALAGLTVDLATASVSSTNHLTDTTQAAQVAGLVQGYNQQLGELLTRARNLDRETAEALGQLPPPAPGSGKPGPKITKEDLANLKGKTPQQVHDWWEGLNREQQEQAIRDFPRVVGWMDGVPAIDRDRANRIGLAQEKQLLQQQLHDPDRAADQNEILNQLYRVEAIERGLQKMGPRGMLLGFDTTSYAGDGKVIMAMGNPDTARHTGVWVPGLSTTLEASMDDNIDRIMAINSRADALTPERSGDVSTVYWLGYDAPDLNNVSVTQNDRSMAGRDPYLNYMQSLRVTHDSDVGHLVAMGHSYGTTIVGEAAKTGQLPVDDIVVAGSPGMHVGSVSDLNMEPRHVWAGASDSDPVAKAAAAQPWDYVAAPLLFPVAGPAAVPLVEAYADHLHGMAPTDPHFGAYNWKADTSGHTNYWDPDSESLKNQARVLAGVYNKVTPASVNTGNLPPENWR
ncbi:hypothetical protein BJY16_001767 [Actinoplanes octamycinicus]|uniref:DUF1023 domain-containing protein n=1 Tax=Actinoplanes octamycinicus TaxID=135948 RepID=A0A7W7GU32_9ACTN|nr:alpha/beta hydrolase [Actinoplanes octamycinicus]MBB4738308.1 hypothetical protein [Actinoplanes octamycinicus]GIE57425.1 hypothetical protein Aoc01nite_28270 [Actinoplanes octamycinicus]